MSVLKIETTSRFRKDYKRMSSRNDFDATAFEKVIQLLLNNELLPEKYCNHLLEPKGNRTVGMPHKTKLATNLYKRRRKIDFIINKNRKSFRFI